MTDDTRNAAAASPAPGRGAANPSEGEARSKGEARRTIADLLARSFQARFAAVARQAVALGLSRAGAAEFTRVSTGDWSHGFPEGSDYGALCEQDDLSKEQAEAIYHEVGQAVRAEAGHMQAEADPETAAVIAGQIAEWEKGAALEWAHMRRVRDDMDREEQQSDSNQEESSEGRANAGAAASPGHQYVVAYLLQEADNDCDTDWIAECIDDGRLIACPRCHFLHLPTNPFPRLGWEAARLGVPADACDVCAALPAMCETQKWGKGWEKALAYAGDDVADERAMRAVTLYRLWIGASDGADALRVAAMAEGLAGLVRQTRETGTAGG